MNYLFAVLSLLISMSLALLIIPKLLIIAVKHSLFDKIDERKTHTGDIPRIGGVSFVPCILFSMMFIISIFNMFFSDGQGKSWLFFDNSELSLFICGLLLIYLGGIKDDLMGMSCVYKFAIQVVSSLLLIFSGLYINGFYGFLGVEDMPIWICIPLTIVIMVFIINSINLIDGMDGLASGISIFALCIYGTLFMLQGLWYYSVLAFSTVGVLVTFFYYNVFGNVKKGRKLFMGDSGSLTLGFILAFLAIRYTHYSPGEMPPVNNSFIIAFSPILIPMLDVLRVMASRIRRHKHLFKPDRSHIHHKLMDMGISKTMALLVLLSMCSGFCVMNFLLIGLMNCTFIFIIDLALWIFMNMYFSYIIKKQSISFSKIVLNQSFE